VIVFRGIVYLERHRHLGIELPARRKRDAMHGRLERTLWQQIGDPAVVDQEAVTGAIEEQGYEVAGVA